MFKALANRNRIRILKLLAARPMCVCELRFVLGIAQPTVSRHLQALKQAGLIEDQTNGVWTDYRLCFYPKNHWLNPLLKTVTALTMVDARLRQDEKKAKLADRKKLCQR
ncbi:MAG TPA: metalloregulator ArsR/SmtB family transcription factor [bacterium]|nr:metalloregulator ArsR/SmtB family transcription factor [bacterium]